MDKSSIETLYFSLREEIAYNQKQENVLTVFTYSVVGTVLTFSYQYEVEWGALLVMFLLIPLSFRIGRFRNTIAYISGYMRNALEPLLDIRWETDHFEFQQKHRQYRGIVYYIANMDCLIFTAIAIACFWIIHINNNLTNNASVNLGAAFLQMVCLTLSIKQFISFVRYEDRKQAINEDWQEYVKNK